MTCAHVAELAQQRNAPLEIRWQAQSLPASIWRSTASSASDLALLQVSLTQHPCVLLQGGAEPFSKLYSYGYPATDLQGISTTFECEGWAGSEKESLKFKLGMVNPGMSGSPLLNQETGCVCGIVQITLGRSTLQGGKGLLAMSIYAAFSELEAQCKAYHQQETRWLDAMTQQQRQRIARLWKLPSKEGISVYFSYAPEDEDMRMELTKQLTLMERFGQITSWYANKIVAGGDRSEEAKAHFDSAQIILLLISPDFVISNTHFDEMNRAWERAETGRARVIPILLRFTEGYEETDISKLLTLPRNSKPLAAWKPRDAGFYEVAKEIREVVKSLKSL